MLSGLGLTCCLPLSVSVKGSLFSERFIQTLGASWLNLLLPPLIRIFCQFWWPVITSIALYLASWTPVFLVNPSYVLLKDSYQLPVATVTRFPWWKLFMAPISFHIKSKPLFPWLSKPFMIWPHATCPVPSLIHLRIYNLLSLLSVMLSRYVLVELSSLTLAFSKHIYSLPMKLSLMLLNLIFYSSEFIGICDMCNAMLCFILF